MAMPAHTKHFLAECLKYVMNAVFADFTIRFKGEEYKVNHQLLAYHSPYFKAVFERKFKVSAITSNMWTSTPNGANYP